MTFAQEFEYEEDVEEEEFEEDEEEEETEEIEEEDDEEDFITSEEFDLMMSMIISNMKANE